MIMYLFIFQLVEFLVDSCLLYNLLLGCLFMHMSQNMYLKVEFLGRSLFLSST